MDKEKFSFYKEYPKTCQPDDFWGQVKRTVNGRPVSSEQIEMIVNAVAEQLNLQYGDVLLDLCCGNGALTSLFFEYCDGGLGVDFSEYLINVANQHFASQPEQSYLLADVVEFCESPINPEKYNKAVCYGSFAYLEVYQAERLLLLLAENFPNLTSIFLGNCPDKTKIKEFYGDRPFESGVEDEADSAIGIWRDQAEFKVLAQRTGWNVKIHIMPETYYAAHYRYDVILTR